MKCFVRLTALLLLGGALQAQAGPGDTTWVQAHQGTHLSWYNNYDTTVQFPAPGASYRRIYMVFTLGKYACPGYNPNNAGDGPGQTGWCGDWDYTVQNYLMTPSGDTLELGRLITPYARQTAARTPLSWTQRYVFDVTDYYPLLQGNASHRIHYSGYSGGFTADVKFAFIEGTPARNVLGIDRLWHGSFAFGKASDPIENHLQAVSLTAPAGARSAAMQFIVTGHGYDGQATQCAEFCSKYYQVKLNNNVIDQADIWRNDCGSNHLYPQSGTWIYNRANWCPGDQVAAKWHTLQGVSGGNNFSVDVDLEPYNGNGTASYTLEGAVFYYGPFNHQLDASLEEIIAPTDFEGRFRENPACSKPVIRLRNTGSETITSMRFEYGMPGAFQPQYFWQGTLAPLEETIITLPDLWELRDATGATATQTFLARILEVNGQADEDATNNEQQSRFIPAPRWPVNLVVTMRTNSGAAAGLSQNRWAVYNSSGSIVAERKDLALNTTYTDTLNLGPDCYRLEVQDAGCDGLSWWANPGAGNGNFFIRPLSTAFPLPLKGYFSGDFGCGFTQHFSTGFPLSVPSGAAAGALQLEAFPNPAQDYIDVQLRTTAAVHGHLKLLNALGQTVRLEAMNQPAMRFSLQGLPAGVYTLVFEPAEGRAGRLQTRVVLQ